MPMAIATCVHQRGESSAHPFGESDMKNLLARFIREEEGQDVIEYALLGAFISVVAGGLIVTVGEDVIDLFTTIEGALPPA
jgi:pilus assembly protein Flp/PilA